MMTTATDVDFLVKQISTAELNLAVLNENLHGILHDRVKDYFQKLVAAEKTDVDQRRIWAAYSTEQKYTVHGNKVVFTTDYYGTPVTHSVPLNDLL